MSDATASPPASSLALPGSERADYRGKCLYKTGKCTNERALKTSGAAHNLCDDHRNKQNEHQRKLDAKNRQHKRERRVSAPPTGPKSERFAPYQTPPAKREARSPCGDVSDDAESTAPTSPPAAATSVTTCSVDAAVDTNSTVPVLATASSGVMYLPNGPQPPQVSYPFVMQDFDGIVVPLPSYLEGQERIEFRSRIYQKVLDFISEECILRFGAKTEPAAVDSTTAAVAAVLAAQASKEPGDDVGASDPSISKGDDATDAQQAASEESRTSKKVR